MGFKFSNFLAAFFAVAVFSLSMSSVALAQTTKPEDDPKLLERVPSSTELEATSGTSADCPTGKCLNHVAPGFHNAEPLIAPPADSKPANPTDTTPVVE